MTDLLTQVAKRLDLRLPVVDERGDVEQLVVVGARLVELAHGLVGGADVGACADLRGLVAGPLPDVEVEQVEVQRGGCLAHGRVHGAQTRGRRGLPRLVTALPEHSECWCENDAEYIPILFRPDVYT